MKTILLPGILLLTACHSPDKDTGIDISIESGHEDRATETVESSRLSGTVIDENGAPIRSVQVRFCDSSCYISVPDEDGGFAFTVPGSGLYTLQIVSPADPGMATVGGIVELNENDDRILSPIIIATYKTNVALSGQGSIDIDGGLIVEANPDSMEMGSYSETEEKRLSSVHITPSDSGVPTDGIDPLKTIVAMWHLGAFDYSIDPPWSFQGNLNIELPEGTILDIYSANNTAKTWDHGGTAIVNSEGVLTTTTGSGIGHLSTLLLISE